MRSYDGFLSYLQNSTANSAHLAANFCPALVCPHKATVRIQFFPYFWYPTVFWFFYNSFLHHWDKTLTKTKILTNKSILFILPKNSQRIFKKIPQKCQRIPTEFPKKSQKIPQKIRLPKKFLWWITWGKWFLYRRHCWIT